MNDRGYSAGWVPNWGKALITVFWLLALGGPALAQGASEERNCADALQGKVAWSQRGDRQWSPVNISALCAGTGNAANTIACFQAQIGQHNSWSRAIDACKARPPALPMPAQTSQTFSPPQTLKPLPAGLNGRNAVSVTIGQGGRRLGEIRQGSGKQWLEFDATGRAAFQFEEQQRDDWSVYLVDKSRGVNLQLDLHTRKVMVSEAGGPRRDLYEIQMAAAAPSGPVDGRNVISVVFGQGGQRKGEYRKLSPQQWGEVGESGQLNFRFDEVQRDDWSVYLVDKSRGVNLQLDLHTRKVMYSDATSPRRVLYEVLGASN